MRSQPVREKEPRRVPEGFLQEGRRIIRKSKNGKAAEWISRALVFLGDRQAPFDYWGCMEAETEGTPRFEPTQAGRPTSS